MKSLSFFPGGLPISAALLTLQLSLAERAYGASEVHDPRESNLHDRNNGIPRPSNNPTSSPTEKVNKRKNRTPRPTNKPVEHPISIQIINSFTDDWERENGEGSPDPTASKTGPRIENYEERTYPTSSPTIRKVGKSCDDMPRGYCHKRTKEEEEYLEAWNELQVQQKEWEEEYVSLVGDEYTTTYNRTMANAPKYFPYAPGEYEPIEGIMLAFDGEQDGSYVYDMDVVARIAAAITNPYKKDRELEESTNEKVTNPSSLIEKRRPWWANSISTNPPTNRPTNKPTNRPTNKPTTSPTENPTLFPTYYPTTSPPPTESGRVTKVFMVSNRKQKPIWQNYFNTYGVDMSKVVWIEEEIDSVWIRDYGPRFICDPETAQQMGSSSSSAFDSDDKKRESRDGEKDEPLRALKKDMSKISMGALGAMAAIDTKYYAYREYDDSFPSNLESHLAYDHLDLNTLIHSGGNGHYFSTGESFSTRLITSDYDNQALTDEEIINYWKSFSGSNLNFFDKLSFNVDGTGHIDMWFLPVDDTTVIIGQFEEEDSYGSQKITDEAAKYMEGRGFKVYRTPNWNGYSDTEWVHFTYTNSVIANDVVVVPKYLVEPQDTFAYGVFAKAFPGRTIVQVDSSRVIQRSGVLHCMTQHVYDCSVMPPTDSPSIAPSFSTAPSDRPTTSPSSQPTSAPSSVPSISPSAMPSLSSEPSTQPSVSPSHQPSIMPSLSPSFTPSSKPSSSLEPSRPPTSLPSSQPSSMPSSSPSSAPSYKPSDVPSSSPSTAPSSIPSAVPSLSMKPSSQPSVIPSHQPSIMPSMTPSSAPSAIPSGLPSSSPSGVPTSTPSSKPSSSLEPSLPPTTLPSSQPSSMPSSSPSLAPSNKPSDEPSSSPSIAPSSTPSAVPSLSMKPSLQPSAIPSHQPSIMPSMTPSSAPSAIPSGLPSSSPSGYPTSTPSSKPTSIPSSTPSTHPSSSIPPSSLPSVTPTSPGPSSAPSGSSSPSEAILPSLAPSFQPSAAPTMKPTNNPTFQPSRSPTVPPTEPQELATTTTTATTSTSTPRPECRKDSQCRKPNDPCKVAVCFSTGKCGFKPRCSQSETCIASTGSCEDPNELVTTTTTATTTTTTTTPRPECTRDSQCRKPEDPCKAAVCFSSGKCGFKPLCSKSETCIASLDNCYDSIDCNFPGCSEVTISCDEITDQQQCKTAGCRYFWQKCTGENPKPLCLGTPDRRPACVSS